MDQIELFIQAIGTTSYDSPLLKNSVCTIATKEETVFELTVVSELCNSLGSMHGGAIAASIDLFTSAALCPHRREGFWELQGVSRSLNVMYLRPASLGATVLFKCKVVSLGKRTAALSCEVYDSSTKKLLATGTHDKVNIDAPVSRL